jgi:hypothetical protein
MQGYGTSSCFCVELAVVVREKRKQDKVAQRNVTFKYAFVGEACEVRGDTTPHESPTSHGRSMSLF